MQPSAADRSVAVDPEDGSVGAAERRFVRLLSVIRHELTTPLSVIKGYAEMLDPEDTGEVPTIQDVMEAFPAIRRNAELAMLLVGRLQDVDRIVDGGEIELERHEVDLIEVVNTIVDDVYDTLLRTHPVAVDSPDGELVAEVDTPRIRQILFNLLSNAVKYTDPGTHVTIDVRPQDQHVEVTVMDEGDGIAPSEIERAFAAFSRVTDEEEGTGLGLAISRVLARAHGGDLVAEPAPQGPGTRFVLSLPYAVEA